MARNMVIREDCWPLKQPFIISRGSKLESRTVTVELRDGDYMGRGECVPYGRYGETIASVTAQIESLRELFDNGLNRHSLQSAIPAGAARNAFDCAFWDLEANMAGKDVASLAGLSWPHDIPTVQTISMMTPEQMGAEARQLSDFPVLKLKLNAEQVVERVTQVHRHAPHALLLVDANESWTLELLNMVAPQLAQLGVVMIEQPLAVGADDVLSGYNGPLPLFADESCHVRADLDRQIGLYQGVNIKLDKTGGLTEALALFESARQANLQIMLGSMVSSSLGIAPAMFIAAQADFVDLDSPALIARDRNHHLTIENGVIPALSPHLWGGGISRADD